jgi:hypothetical protein
MSLTVVNRDRKSKDSIKPMADCFNGIKGPFYSCLLINRVTNGKRTTIIGYSENPWEIKLENGWELSTVFQSFSEPDAKKLCKEWTQKTRGIQSQINRAHFLSEKYHVVILQ